MGMFPQGVNKLRILIYSKKIKATNLWTPERPSWYIEEKDIKDWIDSKPKNIKHESIQTEDM